MVLLSSFESNNCKNIVIYPTKGLWTCINSSLSREPTLQLLFDKFSLVIVLIISFTYFKYLLYFCWQNIFLYIHLLFQIQATASRVGFLEMQV